VYFVYRTDEQGLRDAARRGDGVKRIVLWILGVCLITPVVVLGSFLGWSFIASNGHPPKMFSPPFANRNRLDPMQLSAAITEILQKNFPSGTDVNDLKSALYKEGFRDLPPPPPDCVPREKEAEVPLGRVYTRCYDNSNRMKYAWAIRFVCTGYIYAKWTTHEDGKVDRIEGDGLIACL
jgi:hypothetical protein